ncbi:Hpt domain-containing protein [Phaeobacter sp. B1627]|uniref:Hpt domain-containing protein n=1 Tax=Phaeobacter sp. B1627 TaxID=2583809 RepID=UPI00111AA74B|nr:Hpt domain-containing protein [Phaeobacter sp. B1627]TNJ45547.1 Hpt domain-containing protein [Phaeobacter sp. B1627]
MINWPHVRELKQEVGEDGFEEVIELFLEEVEEVIEKLATDDRSQLAQDLHFLKGSALNLGFQDFSTKCLEGERLAASGKSGDVNLSGIIGCYAQSKAAFLSEVTSKA